MFNSEMCAFVFMFTYITRNMQLSGMWLKCIALCKPYGSGVIGLFILIRSNKMQQYAGIYLLQNHSTCFGCSSYPSLGVHKTVAAASGTGHTIWATTFLLRGQSWPRWRKVVAQKLWPVPEAAVTVGHVGGRLLLRYYDLYQRLQLQFYVLLMMGAMDTRNM